MKSAELPVEEAKSAEPAFSDVRAKPKEEEKKKEERKQAERPAISRAQEAREWKPSWLNRNELFRNSNDVDDLIALAQRVNKEGKEKFGIYYTEYLPLASSKRQSVLSSFKKRFNI